MAGSELSSQGLFQTLGVLFAQFYTETWFLILMVVILLALIGLLLYLRKQTPED